ncbi:3-hydroxyacyl-CoA dehydrogenase NAD-binding domain-containing protein [Stackebrandtia soli]|uniref:3-hydroxyacyl-CoA dehydrogenase n=1 Tax=Stackebrandtia soli TaxID=1892856 RepID=UPI0039EC6D91
MINTVGVVGLGTMGAGIAEVFAKAGLTVIGVEAVEAAAEAGRARLDKSLDRQLAKGRLDQATRDDIAARLTVTTDLSALAAANLVIEAVPELIDIKRDLFTRLDEICPQETILATNTSSLSVTTIAETTKRASRVVGMHFFNPAPIMKLVEVVETVHSDDTVVSEIADLAKRVGKTPVVIGDRPGFIANRLLFGYLNHAIRLLAEGRASRDEIDGAMKSVGFPMGPLMLLDVIGLDTSVEVLDSIHSNDGASPRHDAAPLLRQLVADGSLGRKTGHGFYDHTQPVAAAELSEERAAEIVAELLPPHIAEAREMAASGYASEADIDTAMTLGCGYPKGPFAFDL